jgi:hypothetical protein
MNLEGRSTWMQSFGRKGEKVTSKENARLEADLCEE